MPPRKIRLANDIGGTFTDTVLVEDDETVLASAKTLTTHANPADGAMAGAERVMAQTGCALGEITGFVHGTTLATNALIERRGAVVATITTEGFRDILEIAYERRYSQYDIDLQKPDLLVPRERAFAVPERMSVDGKALIELDETAVDIRLKGRVDDIPGKGELRVEGGDYLVFDTPGGGGVGPPQDRDRAVLAQDVKRGLVTEDRLAIDYGVEQ